MYQSRVCDNPSCSDIFVFHLNFFNILLLLRAYLKSCPGLSFTNITLTFLLSDKLVLQSALKKISIIIFVIFLIEVIYLSLPNFIVKKFSLLPIIYIFPLSLFFLLIIYNLKENYKKFKK